MKLMKKIVAVALVVMSLVTVALPALAVTNLPVASYAYTVLGDVAVRSSPSSGNNIITRVNTGTKVYILQSASQSRGYYKVSISNITSGAYIREDCLGTNPPAPSENTYQKTMYVDVTSGETVNVRSGPSTSDSVIGYLGRGTKVTTKAITTDGKWVKLSTPKENGYIMVEFLSLNYIGGTTSTNRPYDETSAFGSYTLVRGSAGNAVKNLQIALQHLEILDDGTSNADGIFGSKTEAAVKTFQTRMNISVDGQVGPETKKILWEAEGNWLKVVGVAL